MMQILYLRPLFFRLTNGESYANENSCNTDPGCYSASHSTVARTFTYRAGCNTVLVFWPYTGNLRGYLDVS